VREQICRDKETHTHTNTYRSLSPAYSVLAGFRDGEAILIVSFNEVVTQELPKRDKMNKQVVTVIHTHTYTFGGGFCHFHINTMCSALSTVINNTRSTNYTS